MEAVLDVDCHECSGSRSIPDIFGDPGPCPVCVIDAGATFVVIGADEE